MERHAVVGRANRNGNCVRMMYNFDILNIVFVTRVPIVALDATHSFE
jgi:hypothetical protein